MTALSPSISAELRKRLCARRAELVAQIRSRLEGSDEPAAISMLAHLGQADDMPQADAIAHDEMALLDHERDQLRAIDAALKRLDAGVANVCIVCGREISTERLLANPTAQTCINCQELIESTGYAGPGPSM
jgi:DnaK suppressor protein